MAEKTTTLRLRRIRFKSGGEIRVLRPSPDTAARDGLSECAASVCAGPLANQMVGWALVAWSRDGHVAVNYHNSDASPVPGGGRGAVCGRRAGRRNRRAVGAR